MAFIFTCLALISLLLTCTTSAFSGNFELTNLVVSSPFQANPYSNVSTYVEFDFCDQDTPEVGPTHCGVQWAVGLAPPASSAHTCANASFVVTVTSWHGVADLTLNLGHKYIDNSVGQAPYNVLTKYASFNLTYPTTPFYECDMECANCKSCDGEAIIANVTTAVA